MKKLLFGFLGVALLMVTAPVYGQAGIRGISISGGFMSWEPDEIDERGMLIYGGARVMVSPVFGVEATVGRWSTEMEIDEAEADIKNMPISFSGLFVFQPSPQTPVYAFGGGGFDYHMWSVEGKGDYKVCEGDESSFGFHFLGGAEYEVAPNVRVGGQFKYFTGKVEMKIKCKGSTQTPEVEADYNGMSIGAFVRYCFPISQ